MFEIYREAQYSGRCRVVYFTELHNKDSEINRGFLHDFGKDEAKHILDPLVERLNRGEAVTAGEIEAALGEHLA